MNLSLIVAVASNGVIGKDNQLPWKLKEDLKHFKEITWGGVVIMGRKTFESIGRPLPGRRNIVLSRNPSFTAPGIEVVQNLEEAFKKVKGEPVFVIGGSSLFQEAWPKVNYLYLTLLDRAYDGDTYFKFDWKNRFEIVSEIKLRSRDDPELSFSYVEATCKHSFHTASRFSYLGE